MKRFLLKVLLLAALSAGIAAALALLAYSGPVPTRFGSEVFRAIRVCTSAAPQARTLVLGDSVANQIFGTGPKLPSRVAVAVSNQAVTPLGNRILLDRWLALNPQAEEVVYVLIPRSLQNDGTPQYTFHYLLHPFLETGAFDDAPPETLAHLRRRFGRLPIENPSLRHLLYRNDRLYDLYERRIVRRPGPVPGGGLPSIVVDNLRAMRDACAARGVRFRIAFPPVSRAKAPSAAFRVRCAEQLRDVVPGIDALFADLRVEPNRNFRDGVHFTRERLGEIRDGLRVSLLDDGRGQP